MDSVDIRAREEYIPTLSEAQCLLCWQCSPIHARIWVFPGTGSGMSEFFATAPQPDRSSRGKRTFVTHGFAGQALVCEETHSAR